MKLLILLGLTLGIIGCGDGLGYDNDTYNEDSGNVEVNDNDISEDNDTTISEDNDTSNDNNSNDGNSTTDVE